MARTEKKNKGRKISVWNWMGTLILCSIPGVNIIALILTIILAKTQQKRSYAIAALILIFILLALTCAAFLIFPEEIAGYAAELRGTSIRLPEITA